MRREGRPHGVVRTHVILSPPSDQSSRVVNRLKSPTTAAVFTRVPSKPTNHSKFTDRCCKSMCTICHLQLVGKAKTKSRRSKKFGVGADLDDFAVYGDGSRFDGGDDIEDEEEDEVRDQGEDRDSSSNGCKFEGWVVLKNVNNQVLIENN